MANNLTSSIELKVAGTGTLSTTGATKNFSHTIIKALANGTTALKANRFWFDERTLAGSASEDIDVFDLAALDIGAGAGLDSFGQTFAMTGIAAILVENLSTSAGNLLVGNKNATTAWNSMFNGSDVAEILLVPGAAFLFVDPSAGGLAVADVTNHLLTMTDTGSGCTYKITIIGKE